MAHSGASGSRGPRSATRETIASVAEQRHTAALQRVSELRGSHPGETTDELCGRLIRLCARDLGFSGAVSGGAASSRSAARGTSTLLGAEDALHIGRLGELVMGIGALYGHQDAPVDQRCEWIAAALSAAEGTALGITGITARKGARTGSGWMRRVSALSGGSRARRLSSVAASRSGPLALARLLPYGLGASVGAVGNTALALSVGRAATEYFAEAGSSNNAGSSDNAADPSAADPAGSDEIWDAEFVSERIVDEG